MKKAKKKKKRVKRVLVWSKKLSMWHVGCHTADSSTKSNSCEQIPTCLVRGTDGSVTPKCYQHSRAPYYEVVAKIEWTAAAKRMRLSMEGPGLDR